MLCVEVQSGIFKALAALLFDSLRELVAAKVRSTVCPHAELCVLGGQRQPFKEILQSRNSVAGVVVENLTDIMVILSHFALL